MQGSGDCSFAVTRGLQAAHRSCSRDAGYETPRDMRTQAAFLNGSKKWMCLACQYSDEVIHVEDLYAPLCDAPGLRFEGVSVPGLDGFPPVSRDAAPWRVPTTRQTGERRRPIIVVRIIASLNRVTNLQQPQGTCFSDP